MKLLYDDLKSINGGCFILNNIIRLIRYIRISIKFYRVKHL